MVGQKPQETTIPQDEVPVNQATLTLLGLSGSPSARPGDTVVVTEPAGQSQIPTQALWWGEMWSSQDTDEQSSLWGIKVQQVHLLSMSGRHTNS